MTTPPLTTILRLAADALHELYDARFHALVPTDEAELDLAIFRIPACRATAVGLLRLADLLLPHEPALPPAEEPGEATARARTLPQWPAREERGALSTGPRNLADVVELGAESRLDDHRYGEGLRRWCREYEDLLEEAGIPNEPRVSPREFDEALAAAGVARGELDPSTRAA